MVLQPAEWILVLFPSTFISSVPSLYVNCNVLRSGFQIETIKSFDKAQSGEQGCKQFYMTNKMPDIHEEPDIWWKNSEGKTPINFESVLHCCLRFSSILSLRGTYQTYFNVGDRFWRRN